MSESGTFKKTNINFVLAAVMAFIYLMILALGFLEGGQRGSQFIVHEWLGLTVAGLIGLHLVLHWKWIQAMTGRMMAKTAGKARWNYIIDAVLLGAFILSLGSGALISETFGISARPFIVFKGLHHLLTKLTIVGVVIHLGWHWNWIVCRFREILGTPVKNDECEIEQ